MPLPSAIRKSLSPNRTHRLEQRLDLPGDNFGFLRQVKAVLRSMPGAAMRWRNAATTAEAAHKNQREEEGHDRAATRRGDEYGSEQRLGLLACDG